MKVFSDALRPHPEHSGESAPRDGLASLELSFSCDELASYTKYRKTELTKKKKPGHSLAAAFDFCAQRSQ
jgi:hypothetical protein